jgi:chitinase
VIYPAPRAPPALAGGASQLVQVQAVALGNDALTSPVHGTPSVTIRLVPPGVILPPADTPVAEFNFSPGGPTVGAPVTFDGSPSTGVLPIASYSWNFGDGTSGSGLAVNHTFGTAASFLVTLTVTNTRGIAASKSKIVTVGQAALPQPRFVVSPASPVAGDPVQFTDNSGNVSGRTNVKWEWNFGEPTSSSNTGTGQNVTHTYAAAGGYVVVLTVTDDLGQKATSTATVTIKAAATSGSN